MGGSSASNKQVSQQITTTTQTDRRVGLSEGSVGATEGSTVIGGGITKAGRDITVNSLDPDTIAGALGLSREVATGLTDLAKTTVLASHNTQEHSTATVAQAFDRFGQDLAGITDRVISAAQTGGISELNKTLVKLAGLGVAGFVIYLLLRRKP